LLNDRIQIPFQSAITAANWVHCRMQIVSIQSVHN